MKQFEARDVVIGEYKFYIFPFSAFKAANISAELGKTIAPILPVLNALSASGENMLTVDISAVVSALSNLSGDGVENMLKRLITKEKNVTVDIEGENRHVTEELLNEIFCGSVEDLYKLAFEVVKVNFSGFFKKVASQSGRVTG